MKECQKCERIIDEEKVFISVTKFIDGRWKDFCRDCISPSKFKYESIHIKTYTGGGIPDVFWDGKPEENLADDPHTGKPRTFTSKGEKDAYLKSKGLQEAGDKFHGAPISFMQNQNRKVVDSKAEVQAALRKVQQMSPDYRRQEYLKIIKEGKNARS